MMWEWENERVLNRLNKPECKSLVGPISALAISFASLCPIPWGSAAPHKSPAATDAHKIRSGNPWLYRHATWSNRRQRAFHFVPDVMNSYRPIFVFPSKWTPIARTSFGFFLLRARVCVCRQKLKQNKKREREHDHIQCWHRQVFIRQTDFWVRHFE